jgi:hypothetical protein
MVPEYGQWMLLAILRELYESEINVSIASFWDAGWEIKIGDLINGFQAKATFDNDSLETTAGMWLTAQAVALYPRSAFAAARRNGRLD